MIYLLDVNVLIALCDPSHPHEALATRFFQTHPMRDGWATCPLVQNGFLRIFGSRKYPGGPGSSEAARPVLASLLSAPGHQFWPDDVSLMDARIFPNLPSSGDLTDIYLLALAVKHKARFATFDAGIDSSLIHGGSQACQLITS